MMRRATIPIGLALLVAACSSAFAQPAAPPGKPPKVSPTAQKPPQTISIEKYREQLQKAQAQLKAMEERPPRKLGPS